jgi:hypothetical protein
MAGQRIAYARWRARLGRVKPQGHLFEGVVVLGFAPWQSGSDVRVPEEAGIEANNIIN